MGVASRALAAVLLSMKTEWAAHFFPAENSIAAVRSIALPAGMQWHVPTLRGAASSCHQAAGCAPSARSLTDGHDILDSGNDDAIISHEEQAEMEHFIDSKVAHSVAAFFSAIAVALSIHLIYMHLVYYSRPLLQRQIVRIIMIVPVYAICSAFSLTFEHYAVYINTIRDVYEAYCIHCFLVLMLDFPGGEPAVVEGIKDKPKMKHPIPCCCWPSMRMGVDFIVYMKRTTLQFVVLKPLMALFAIVCMLSGVYDDDAVQWFLLVMYNLSYTTALYGLLLFYMATKVLLKPFKPVRKFAAVKIIVFATYYQSLIVVAIPGMDELGSSERWNDFIICFEMALFAIMHEVCFSHREFMPGGVGVVDLAAQGYEEPVNLRLDTSPQAAFARLFDVFDFKDTWDDVKRNFSSDAGTHIMLGVEGGILNDGTAQRLDDEEPDEAFRAARTRALGFGERGVTAVEAPGVDKDGNVVKERAGSGASEDKVKGVAGLGGALGGFMSRGLKQVFALGGGKEDVAASSGDSARDSRSGSAVGAGAGGQGAVSSDFGGSEFASFGDSLTGADAAGDAAAAEAYNAVLAAGKSKAAVVASTATAVSAAAAAFKKKGAAAAAAREGKADDSAGGAAVAPAPVPAPAPPASKQNAAAALVEASAAAAADMLKKIKEQQHAAKGSTAAPLAGGLKRGEAKAAPAPAPAVTASFAGAGGGGDSDGPDNGSDTAPMGPVDASATGTAEVTPQTALRPVQPMAAPSAREEEEVAEGERALDVRSPGGGTLQAISPTALAAEVETAASTAVLREHAAESPVQAAGRATELSSRQKAALARQGAGSLKLDARKVHAATAAPAAPVPSVAWDEEVSFDGPGDSTSAGASGWANGFDADFGGAEGEGRASASAPAGADTGPPGWDPQSSAFGCGGEDDAEGGAVESESRPRAASGGDAPAEAPAAEWGADDSAFGTSSARGTHEQPEPETQVGTGGWEEDIPAFGSPTPTAAPANAAPVSAAAAWGADQGEFDFR